MWRTISIRLFGFVPGYPSQAGSKPGDPNGDQLACGLSGPRGFKSPSRRQNCSIFVGTLPVSGEIIAPITVFAQFHLFKSNFRFEFHVTAYLSRLVLHV